MSNLILTGISVASTIMSADLTIDHTKCGASNSSNFPVEVSLSGTNMKTIANGGFVQRADGFDIVFYSDSGHTTLLPWEVEFYDGTAGILVAHVNLPTVSHTVDTVIYMQVGNPAITTFQGGAAGAAWDTANANYVGVFHFPDGTSLTAADSTSFANTATISGATAGTGQIDGAASYASGNTIKIPNSTNYDSTTGRWSFWVNTTESLAAYHLLMARQDAFSHNGITISQAGTTGQAFVQVYSTVNVIGGLTGGPAIDDGSWHKITYEFNGTSASTLYVDGSSVGTATPTGSWGFNHQTVDTGLTTDNFWQQFVGLLDEIRIMSNNPGADWETTEYNNQFKPGNIGSAGFYSVGSWY